MQYLFNKLLKGVELNYFFHRKAIIFNKILIIC